MEEMRVLRDVAIPVDDGNILRADIFCPTSEKPAPVIMTLGPYGKGVRWKDGWAPQWKWMMQAHPNILAGSTREHMTWETVDPELWVKWGYVCIRVDSRGAGRSPGRLDIFSPRETKDYYDAIEWAAIQPWCSGRVGLCGISYYAINQWLVASLQPPHLCAMIPWEGAADFYRDFGRHGGIACNGFLEVWYPRHVLSIQHGNSAAFPDVWLGESSSGPATLSSEKLAENRSEPLEDILQHPLDDEFYHDRSPDWSRVTVPFLSAANWSGFGLHPRGNFEAFTQAASKHKWLEGHPGKHEEWFYLDPAMSMQKKFLDHFLKDLDNGWDREPPVWLHLRRPFSSEFELRKEHQWPLSNTKWTSMYLVALDKTLGWTQLSKAGETTFDALGQPITFLSAPLENETELTGPISAKIFVSSTTTDADIFITLQAFSPEGKEVEFQGTVDPHTPLAQGWLRASHRKLDMERSTPYRPYHSHDEIWSLKPSEVYELDVEIWPTCIILPAGYRLSLQIGGRDFERELPDTPNLDVGWAFHGSGPWLHTNPIDRPKSIFGGKTTIYTGGSTSSYLNLPIIKPH